MQWAENTSQQLSLHLTPPPAVNEKSPVLDLLIRAFQCLATYVPSAMVHHIVVRQGGLMVHGHSWFLGREKQTQCVFVCVFVKVYACAHAHECSHSFEHPPPNIT